MLTRPIKATNVSKRLLYSCLSVLVPFGQYVLKYAVPDPFGWDKIGSVAANIIAERTKKNSNSKAHVSGNKRQQQIVKVR